MWTPFVFIHLMSHSKKLAYDGLCIVSLVYTINRGKLYYNDFLCGINYTFFLTKLGYTRFSGGDTFRIFIYLLYLIVHDQFTGIAKAYSIITMCE